MAKRKPQLAQTETVDALPLACVDETAARKLIERDRWGNTPCCPHCGDTAVYTMTGEVAEKRGLWRCRGCKKQFTVRVGSIFEDSKIPLRQWCRAMWEATSCKNGISALELSRKLQITYKSALFMMQRIRHAMAPDANPPKLDGTIEADETYVGGKPRYRRVGKTGPHPGNPKAPVFAVLERGGDVRTKVLPSVTAENLRLALTECAEASCRLVTDDLNLYWNAGKPFAQHDKVRHSQKEYVNADDPTIHTNTVEGFFSRVKRGLNGTYHAVSREHLHRYMHQFAFAYNTRGLNMASGSPLWCVRRRASGCSTASPCGVSPECPAWSIYSSTMRPKPGPGQGERLKIGGDWQSAVRKLAKATPKPAPPKATPAKRPAAK